MRSRTPGQVPAKANAQHEKVDYILKKTSSQKECEKEVTYKPENNLVLFNEAESTQQNRNMAFKKTILRIFTTFVLRFFNQFA